MSNGPNTPRDPYFAALEQVLVRAGIGTPVLVIDRRRLDRNIAQLRQDLPAGMAYRIVAKSLPSPALLDHVRRGTGTDRMMTFQLPMVLDLLRRWPEVEQMLGKPLPAAAFRQFWDQIDPAQAEAASNIEWLIDTPERLRDYAEIAQTVGRPLRLALELDVGLHRGGFASAPALGAALEQIRDSNTLSLSGVMGYEPHLASLPGVLGWQQRAKRGVWGRYAGFVAQIREALGPVATDGLIRNAAGSPTFRMYKDTEVANEVSVGSALVKPTHFDTGLLAAYEPAAFIATPVLKVGRTKIPGLEFADGIKQLLDPSQRCSIHTYGGNWMADPVDPAGLRYNKTVGRSSNQELLHARAQGALRPGDFVFLRPQQSEAVFMQFGDIAVIDGDEIAEWWSAYPAFA